jgi:hypothetical protein
MLPVSLEGYFVCVPASSMCVQNYENLCPGIFSFRHNTEKYQVFKQEEEEQKEKESMSQPDSSETHYADFQAAVRDLVNGIHSDLLASSILRGPSC